MKILTIKQAEEWVIGRIVIPQSENIKGDVVRAQLTKIVDEDMKIHGYCVGVTVNLTSLKVYACQAKRHAYELDKFEDNEGRTIYQITRITYNVEEE